MAPDVLNWVRPEQAKVDLVMADPPYAWQGWDVLLVRLEHLRPLVLAETGSDLALAPGWQALRAKRYGGTVVTLARFSEDRLSTRSTTGTWRSSRLPAVCSNAS